MGRSPFLGVVAFDPAVHAFALVDRWGKSDNMPDWSEEPDLSQADELAALSRDVGQVVAFYEIEEGSTSGVYGAWNDGELVRELEWADDQWVKVAGQPQSWEAPLFGTDELDSALEAARDDGRDEAEVRAAFAAGSIQSGAAWPVPQRMAVFIRTALRAPAHGLEPWPRRRAARTP
jgi:hypothetical protein